MGLQMDRQMGLQNRRVKILMGLQMGLQNSLKNWVEFWRIVGFYEFLRRFLGWVWRFLQGWFYRDFWRKLLVVSGFWKYFNIFMQEKQGKRQILAKICLRLLWLFWIWGAIRGYDCYGVLGCRSGRREIISSLSLIVRSKAETSCLSTCSVGEVG